MIMRELTPKDKDKIEQVKQQINEIQKVFHSSIIPQKNHILFEINLITNEILEAKFDAMPVLKWEDAVSGLYNRNKKVTRNENCIYISSLNIRNVHKILKRDYNIILN